MSPPGQKTYDEVFGVKVLATEPVKSPLSRAGERDIYFRGVIKLLLDDGTETYGCTWCGKFVDSKVGRMRLHHRNNCPEHVSEPARTLRYPAKTAKKTEVRAEIEDPPPSAASDILAALKLATMQGGGGNLADLHVEIRRLKVDLDMERAKNKRLEGELSQIRLLMSKLGIMNGS